MLHIRHYHEATSSVQTHDMKGFYALKDDGAIKRYYLLSRDPVQRTVDGIEIMPWKTFFPTVIPI